ncbi:MAG: nuclear transport factor 2 family protein [Sphingobacteriales bacterium]|nr:MAG: nuclear transport factor 2 family protein [Sphingobacteriales bacterium]
MLSSEKASLFAREWIEAFNSHDLERILGHYAEELEFHSPFIPLLKFNETGVIHTKQDLASYFKVGLEAYPDLHFDFHDCYTGTDSLVIIYTSVNGRQAAETFQLNGQGKAIRVQCHYR